LAKEIPNGKIYAVDNDVNMIDKAKDNLSQFENVTIINSDLLDLSLKIISSKVDVIFSSAVLHWILNHQKLFNTFFELLNQNGQLLIQCGGYGNLKKAISIFESKRLQNSKVILKNGKKNGIFQNHQIPKNFLMK
jgi:trans-aconitate 2-methyltransferase